MSEIYDLVIIGGGPGGYVAAIRAAQLGFTVAVVEKRKALGGTCLNEGCIPSKALLDSSELFVQARDKFAGHGILVEPPTLDLAKMMQRKDDIITRLTRGIASLFKKYKITLVAGTGRLGKTLDDGTLFRLHRIKTRHHAPYGYEDRCYAYDRRTADARHLRRRFATFGAFAE